jgi:hypothetical protein
LEQAQAKMKVDQQNADSKQLDAQSKAKVASATAQKIQVDTQANPGGLAGKGGAPGNPQIDQMNAQAKLMDAQSRQQSADTARGKTMSDAHEKKADRASREKLEMLNIAREVLLHPDAAPIAQGLVGKAEKATGEPAAPDAGGEAAPEP